MRLLVLVDILSANKELHSFLLRRVGLTLDSPLPRLICLTDQK